MPIIACDHCSHERDIDMPAQNRFGGRVGDEIRGVFSCSRCLGLSPFGLREDAVTFKPGNLLIISLDQNIPEEVVRFWSEVELCLYAAANRAAVVMARSAVEEALEQKGLTDRVLDTRIKRALDIGLVDHDEYSIAQGSRLIGNGAVHEATVVSSGDAVAAIAAAAKVINRIFS